MQVCKRPGCAVPASCLQVKRVQYSAMQLHALHEQQPKQVKEVTHACKQQTAGAGMIAVYTRNKLIL